MLVLLTEQPGLSLSKMAEALRWYYANGKPNKSLVNRVLATLLKDKLVVKLRGQITLTKLGKDEAAKVGADGETISKVVTKKQEIR